MSPKRLVPSLLVELHQAEHSTCRHAMREANRLGSIPPAAAMRVIGAHANLVIDELEAFARQRDVSLSALGSVLGDTFSLVRDFFVDRVIDVERSYRGTLLGVRHGIDLVRLLRTAAEDEHDHELVTWCDRWLPVRTRLAREAADELEWFGKNPTFARRHPLPVLSARPLPA
jgi:hypothetical protein